ncbi:uncharacterized protein BJX67DRAFT_381566 [Aspergillus lucknowensis]|uniref:DUF676 domain-containing protein n=1 Tax=Aspergillus lucknowensis TaxID=176173 RepID=A0ABR4LR56_9EURO
MAPISRVKEPAKAKVDIVFVHGLHGAQDPWTSEGGVFWPDKILPGKIPDASILSYTYKDKAKVDSIFDRYDLDDLSLDLLDNVMDYRTEKEAEERPIIFVAHCLGGLVVENALLIANEDPSKKEFIGCVHGILLLGTPQFTAGSVAAAANYFRLAGTGTDAPPSDAELSEKLAEIVSIPEGFAQLKASGAEFAIETFWGGQGSKLGDNNDNDVKIIVDEALAKVPGASKPRRLMRTQLQLSQYDAVEDEDAVKVLRPLTQWASKIKLPDEEGKGPQNVSNATFSGSHNSGMQLGQNAGTIKGFTFGRP